MKVLLVDIENCPNQVEQLLENLSDYTQVIICYAKSGAKIPIDWIVPLSQSVNKEALKIIKMPEIKNNAADFGIAFWAGVLMTQLPDNTHFDIVSNDADLDCVVSLLTAQSRSAKRIGTPKKISQSNSVPSLHSHISINEAIQVYCVYLTKHSNKPAKEATLLNSIRSQLKGAIEPREVLNKLISQGIVTIDGTKVNYDKNKLNKFKAP